MKQEVRKYTSTSGIKLFICKTGHSFMLQYSTCLEEWIFTGFSQEQWDHAVPISKLYFLLETGHDLEQTLNAFYKYVEATLRSSENGTKKVAEG